MSKVIAHEFTPVHKIMGKTLRKDAKNLYLN